MKDFNCNFLKILLLITLLPMLVKGTDGLGYTPAETKISKLIENKLPVNRERIP